MSRICIVKLARKKDDPLLEQLLQVLAPISESTVYCIASNFSGYLPTGSSNTNWHNKKHLSGIFEYVYAQLVILLRLITNIANFDIAFFYTGGTILLLPVLAARLARKKTIIVYTGSYPDSSIGKYPSLYIRILRCIERSTLYFSNTIILYSKSSLESFGLSKYVEKIVYANEFFVDPVKFNITTNLAIRKDTIGYLDDCALKKAY